MAPDELKGCLAGYVRDTQFFLSSVTSFCQETVNSIFGFATPPQVEDAIIYLFKYCNVSRITKGTK